MHDLDWTAIGKTIDQEMLKRGLSAADVAHKAGVDRKTVDRIRKGERVRIQTVSWIGQALHVTLLQEGYANTETDARHKVAPSHLGAYTWDAYQDYIGQYFLFRNSFDYPDKLICALLSVYWSNDGPCLRFREFQANISDDGSQHHYDFEGDVAIPTGYGILQFIASSKGMNRIMTTTVLRGNDLPFMRGVLSTVNEISDIGFYPVSTPVYIERRTSTDDEATAFMGSFRKPDIWHNAVAHELTAAAKRFSAFRTWVDET